MCLNQLEEKSLNFLCLYLRRRHYRGQLPWPGVQQPAGGATLPLAQADIQDQGEDMEEIRSDENLIFC